MKEKRLLRPRDLTQLQEPEWLIDGLLPEQALVCLYGDVASFKSFLAFDWACHVVLGRPWQDRRVRQGGVLYIAAEGGARMRRRLQAWKARHGASDKDLEALTVWDEPVALARPHERLALTRATKGAGQDPALMIVDTVNRCLGGGDECAPVDMTRFVDGAWRLSHDLGLCTVLMLHHPGKDKSKGATGAYVLRRAMDTEIKVVRKPGAMSMSLAVTKQKDAEAVNKTKLNMELVEPKGEQSSLVVEPGSAAEVATVVGGGQVAARMKKRDKRIMELRLEGKSTREIANEINVSHMTVARAVKRLGLDDG